MRADRGAAGLTGVLAWLATRGGTRPWSNPSPDGVVLSASSTDPGMSLADAVVGPAELTAAELAAVGRSNAEVVKAARKAAAWRPAPGDLAPWLGISFGTPLRLSHFSLAPTSVVGHLMLLASADNKRWHELAIWEDGTVFVDGVANVAFAVQSERPYRHFRLGMTGLPAANNAGGRQLLRLQHDRPCCAGLELYGWSPVEPYWTVLNHPQQPMRFRRFVSTVLLSAARSPMKKLKLPIELWTLILAHVKFDDFTDRDRLLEIATLKVEIARCTREQERLAAEYAAEEAMFAFVWLVVSAKGGNAEPKDPGAVLARLDADKTQLTLTQAGLLARRAELERRLQGEMRLREEMLLRE